MPADFQVARRLDDPALPGAENMARDAALLEVRSQPTLRFYSWTKPTLSLGYFQRAKNLPISALQKRGYDCVRRKTGGKAILHKEELTYSLCVPEIGAMAGGPKAAMEFLHQSFADELIQQTNLDVKIRGNDRLSSDVRGSAWCFEDSSSLDLVLDGRKLLGSAARRSRGWTLFHGSLVIFPPDETQNIAGLGVFPDIDGFSQRLGNALNMDFQKGTWTECEVASACRLKKSFEDLDSLNRL